MNTYILPILYKITLYNVKEVLLMSNKRINKLIVFFLVVVLASSSFAGCANKTGATKNLIRYDLGAEPKTLDPALNSAVESGTVIMNAFEGLTRFGEGDKPVAGVAETWDVSPDGLTYTFHLRNNAKWSDGKPVVAKDFEYAWKRAVNPETAAEYANYFYYLKNGEAVNTKKLGLDELGVKATDDRTLVVTLENVTSYFLQLTAFPTYMPVRQDMVEADKTAWSTKPASYISNGPFKLSEWRPKDRIILEKNTNYWKAGDVKLDRIEFTMIEEATSRLSAYRSGQLDYIEGPPDQEIPTLLANKEAVALPYLGTYYYSINVTPKAASVDAAAAKATSDVRVRRALTLAIDREALVTTVLKAGQKPATGFVPPGIPATAGGDFTTKTFFDPKGNVGEAKKLLSEAGYPNGQGFPKITLLYNTGSGHQNVAQAVQDMWRKNLGINVELANQEWKVFQVTRTNKEYLIARDGWIGDYMDPMTFLELFTSGNGNNNPGYSNPAYDSKIAGAKKETVAATRDQLLRSAEDLLMTDMPIIPIYFYVNVAMIKDYVKGTRKSQLGFVFFENAYVQK
jgi:oligopeptide transport system substrate-binding protein